MRILNLHGYKGFAENSVCNVLRELGCEVIAPQIDYDGISPKEILKILSDIYEDNNCTAISGTSVGGFFAVQLCVLKKCHAVLINPCLLPFVYLPRLGYDNSGGVMEFTAMFSEIAKLDKRLVSTIVGDNDEIIDTQEYTKAVLFNSRYFTVPGGKHSGFTLPLKELFEENRDSFFK